MPIGVSQVLSTKGRARKNKTKTPEKTDLRTFITVIPASLIKGDFNRSCSETSVSEQHLVLLENIQPQSQNNMGDYGFNAHFLGVYISRYKPKLAFREHAECSEFLPLGNGYFGELKLEQ
jgi:hypothetical protein